MASATIGLALLVVGALVVYWGLERKETHELITRTPTTAVRDLREPGIVELEGSVAPAEVPIRSGDAGGTFVSPLGESPESVLAAWKVEEWDDSGKNSSWKTVATGVWSLPFALDDGTGEVVVDVGDHADGAGLLVGTLNPKVEDGVSFGDVVCEFERFPRVAEVEVDERPPSNVARFVRDEPAVDAPSGPTMNLIDLGNAHGDRRYYERSLSVGDEVYVLGRAYHRGGERAFGPTGPEDLVVTEPRGDDEGLLIVSDQREQDLARKTRNYRIALALGALGILGGIAVLVAGATGV